MASPTPAIVLALILGASAMPMEDVPLEEDEPRSPPGFAPGFRAEALTDEAPIEIPESLRLASDESGEEFDYDPEYYDDGFVSIGVVEDEGDSDAPASETSQVFRYEWLDQSLCGLKLLCESILQSRQEAGDARNPINNFIFNSDSGAKEILDYSKETDNYDHSESLQYCAEAMAKCSLSGEALSLAFINGP